MRKLHTALAGRTLNPIFPWDADEDGKVTDAELTQLEDDTELGGTQLASSMRARLENAGELGWPNFLAAPLDPNLPLDNVQKRDRTSNVEFALLKLTRLPPHVHRLSAPTAS